MTAAVGTEEYAANLALGHLGLPEIAAMSDTTTRARCMRKFFALARDELLREKPWNFATAWVTPALDPVPGSGDLKLRYPLPDDCLRVRYIKGDNRREWAVESGQASVGGVAVEAMVLVTNIAQPSVCYTRRIEAVRLWDPIFLSGFGHLLASYGATQLGKSQSWSDSQRALAMERISTSASIDAKENRSSQCSRPETSWVTARRGGGRSCR